MIARQRFRIVAFNVAAFAVGFVGGGFLHSYLMYLLDTNTVLRDYSWNVPAENAVIRYVFFGDFAVGAVLVTVVVTLIVLRGFNPWRSLLVGLGASIMAYTVGAIVLCMIGC